MTDGGNPAGLELRLSARSGQVYVTVERGAGIVVNRLDTGGCRRARVYMSFRLVESRLSVVSGMSQQGITGMLVPFVYCRQGRCALSTESFPTHPAYKWFLPSVSSYVPHEVVILAERLRAPWAHALPSPATTFRRHIAMHYLLGLEVRESDGHEGQADRS